MAQSPTLTTTIRTESGKGAARRARRAGQVPAVLYGHGSEPQHLLLPYRELAAILRANGTNAVIDLDIDGKSQLALTKQVDVHAIKNDIQHVDLLLVRRGEKVTVDVNILIEGDPAPGTLVVQDASTIQVEAEALHIPENIIVSVEGVEAVTNITAGDLELPQGSTLISAEDTLVVSVNEATKSESESDADVAEGAEASAEEAAE
ncbi:50S ribosomal protein L25/general stress protein Ctc [Gordonia sp. (in: high G+C Gram-positive bacteria)]|uniref:50S ribosomal protein L25/general stress protein Ctc n=1 Tax=Gordonia sp. (in: high G+C Gram-positive bacteria) TaxID=84139 RepID=UPI00352909F1